MDLLDKCVNLSDPKFIPLDGLFILFNSERAFVRSELCYACF